MLKDVLIILLYTIVIVKEIQINIICYEKGVNEMNAMKKKMLTGIIAGAMLLGGGLGTMSAQAETAHDSRPPQMEKQGQRPQHPPVQMDADKAAKYVADTFGVKQSEVKAAIEAKEDFRDIGQAAMLAKVSGKSFKEILAMHKSQSDWKAITKSLGISHAQMREARLEMRAKDIQAVLDMKKINNRWTDVAGQLGVDKSKLRPEGAHHGGPQGGPPPAMPGDGAQE